MSPDRSGKAAQHAVAIYGSDDDLRAGALPYVRAGLDAGETVVLVVTPRSGEVLRRGLGPDAASVRWSIPGMDYGHLGRASGALGRFLAEQRAASAPVRLVTEHGAEGLSDGIRTAAYLRADAVANDIYGPYGYRWVCLYDRRRFPPEVLTDAAGVHPWLVGPDGRLTENAGYVRPLDYLATHPGPVSAVPPAVPFDVRLRKLDDLAMARQQVAETAHTLGLGVAGCRDVKVAAGEVIANAFRHGELPCRIRVWRDACAVVVRVDDLGSGRGLATAGFWPPDLATGSGAGLWLARQFADVLNIQAGPGQTSVEMRFPLN